jgi:hypothetical protein
VRRISVLLLFLSFYYLSFANGNIEPRSETNINWIAVWLCFLFGVLFTILFQQLDRRSMMIDQRSDAGLPLSGWIVVLGLTGVLLYWFFGRRDIFPSMFIYYVSFFLIAQFILWVIYNNIILPNDMAAIRHEMLKHFLRMAVYTIIWGVYIWYSEQVKQTFIYPSN